MKSSTHVEDNTAELGIDTTTLKRAKDRQAFNNPKKSKSLTLMGFW